MALLAARTVYSDAERRSDAVIHVSGLVAVAIAVPILIWLAVSVRGDRPAVLGTVVYAFGLSAMILCSALYNMTQHATRRALYRHLDHTAIFCKIAASYTPFALMSGGQGTWLVTGLWGAAIAGSGFRILAPERLRWLAIVICLAMGWAGAIFGAGLLASLPGPVVVLIVTGGALYTIGVGFFLFERLPFHYTIWHVCVLAASLVLYAAVAMQVVATPTL